MAQASKGELHSNKVLVHKLQSILPKQNQKQILHESNKFIVCTPFLLMGGGGLNLLSNFQKGGGRGLDRISVFRGGLLGRGGDLFQWGLVFILKK